MVFVLALNEVPDTESSDLIGHGDFRVAVGERPPRPSIWMSLAVSAPRPVEKCEKVAS